MQGLKSIANECHQEFCSFQLFETSFWLWYLLLWLWVIMLRMECFVLIVVAWDFKIKQQNIFNFSLISKGFVLLTNNCEFHVWPFLRWMIGLREKRQMMFGLAIWIWIPPKKNHCWPRLIGALPAYTSTLAIDCLGIAFHNNQ